MSQKMATQAHKACQRPNLSLAISRVQWAANL